MLPLLKKKGQRLIRQHYRCRTCSPRTTYSKAVFASTSIFPDLSWQSSSRNHKRCWHDCGAPTTFPRAEEKHAFRKSSHFFSSAFSTSTYNPESNLDEDHDDTKNHHIIKEESTIEVSESNNNILTQNEKKALLRALQNDIPDLIEEIFDVLEDQDEEPLQNPQQQQQQQQRVATKDSHDRTITAASGENKKGDVKSSLFSPIISRRERFDESWHAHRSYLRRQRQQQQQQQHQQPQKEKAVVATKSWNDSKSGEKQQQHEEDGWENFLNSCRDKTPKEYNTTPLAFEESPNCNDNGEALPSFNSTSSGTSDIKAAISGDVHETAYHSEKLDADLDQLVEQQLVMQQDFESLQSSNLDDLDEEDHRHNTNSFGEHTLESAKNSTTEQSETVALSSFQNLFLQEDDSVVSEVNAVEENHFEFQHLHTSGLDSEKNETGNLDGSDTTDASGLREEVERVCLFLQRMTAQDWRRYDDQFIDNEDCTSELEAPDELGYLLKNAQNYKDDHDEEIDDAIERHDEAVLEEDLSGKETILALLLDEASHEETKISVDEFNLVLARAAISPELSMEDLMEDLLEVYHFIKKYSYPNETTYKLLFWSLDRRVSHGTGSCDANMVALLRDMIDFRVKLSSNLLLSSGMKVLDRENNHRLAKEFIMDYALNDSDRSFRVASHVIRRLMKMFAREDKLEHAIALLRKSIEENGKRDKRGTSGVFDVAIRWPDRNRAGQRRDIMHVHQAILKVIMDGKSKYQPAFSTWRNILVALSRSAKADPSRWELLRRPFHALFHQYQSFYPDEFLLRVGLHYCEATRDSKLAKELVVRSIGRRMPSRGVDNSTYSVSASSPPHDWLSDWSVEGSGLISRKEPNDYYDSAETVSMSDTVAFSCDSLHDGRVVANNTTAEPEAEDITDSHKSSFSSDELGEGELASVCQNEIMIDLFEDSPLTQPKELLNIGVAEDISDSIALDMSSETPTTFTAIAYSQAPFSYKVFQKALKVCLSAGDTPSGWEILKAFLTTADTYPKDVQEGIWRIALKGFANLPGNDSLFVKKLFDSMKENGVEVTKEAWGALIHSYAVGSSPDDAIEAFQELQRHLGDRDLDDAPDVTSYNAVMLAHLRNKSWDQVLQTYHHMKKANVTATPATTQTMLIASHRIGGLEKVCALIEDILDANERPAVSDENCYLALKLLVPYVLRGTHHSVPEIQERLRQLGDENETIRPACLNLLRSLRQADIEQQRLPTKHAPTEELVKRREAAWQTTLKDILVMAKAQKNPITQTSSREDSSLSATSKELSSC